MQEGRVKLSKKWNQWLNKKWRLDDKKDIDDLIPIAQWIYKKYSYANVTVRREWFFLFDRETYKLVRIQETVTEGEAKYFQVRCPDLAIFDKKGRLLFIVEIDGDVHRRKLSKTWDRNADYEFAQVRLIVLSKEVHGQEPCDAWFAYLEKEIENLNIDLCSR